MSRFSIPSLSLFSSSIFSPALLILSFPISHIYPNYYDFVAECNNVGYEGGIEFKNGKKPISLMKKLFEISKLSKCDNEIVLYYIFLQYIHLYLIFL